MRVKALAAFLSGVALAAAVAVVTSLCTPTAGAQEGEASKSTTVPGPESLEDIADILQQARTRFRDPDLLAYYDKLVAKYGLDDGGIAAGEETQTLLPDIDRIQQAALLLPFREAGKRIKDDEIREFYYRFVKDAGLSAGAAES
jgi:hypothetical protein